MAPPKAAPVGVADGSPALPLWSLKEEEEGPGGSPPPAPTWGPSIFGTCQVKLTDVRSLSWGASVWAGPVDCYQDSRTEKGPFVCGACGKAFRYRLNLLAHRKRRRKSWPGCAPCGLRFCLKGDLLRHRAGHVAKGPHSGPTCDLAFGPKKHLQGPQAQPRETVAPEDHLACRGEEELQRHRAAPQEERPFVCPTCRARFSWKESLQIHRRLHAQEQGYTCPLCGKTFSRQGNLLAHQRLHTGELPFACPDCGRRFLRRANLMTHRRQPGRHCSATCRSPGGLLETLASPDSPGKVGLQAEAGP